MDLDVWLEIGSNFLLGTLGLVIFVWLALRKYLGKWKFSEIIKRESEYWIWSIGLVALCSITFAVSPETRDSVKLLIGLDLDVVNGFITMGVAIGQLSVKKLNKEQTTKGNDVH